MKNPGYALSVRGPAVSMGRGSAHAIGSVLRWVADVARGSVAMAFTFASSQKGRRPEWLRMASGVEFVDLSGADGDAVLRFEAPRFGDAAADLYKHKELFDIRPDEHETAFDLVAAVVRDVEDEAADSYRFDAGLLRRIATFRNAPARWGVEGLALSPAQRRPGAVLIRKETGEKAHRLRAATPNPQRARIAGILDMIRASDLSFELSLETGGKVRGLLRGAEGSNSLRELWNKKVLVEGKAVFRPSGSLLRIEADAIKTARPADRAFSRLPRPRGSGRALSQRLKLPQTPGTGAAAIFGRWPGEETEEELLAALEEME